LKQVRKTQGRRLVTHPGHHGPRHAQKWDNASVVDGHTLYRSQVIDGWDGRGPLKKGENNTKIGGWVTKGRYKGFPIYTLTLEERETCPRECSMWRACYGNNMPYARRLQWGPKLEAGIHEQLHVLSLDHPNGFLVRLHVLGDFYSARYVKKWEFWLERYPALHVFGFTARNDVVHDPIAANVARLVDRYGLRFAIRFSNTGLDRWATETLDMPWHKSDHAVVCPQQTGKTETCGTCGICWSTDKVVAFLRH
jgi:hypothetical protein